MKRILCIWLPKWPLQRLCSARPELKSQDDPLADREALQRLAAHCDRFSPTVGLEQSAVPESLLLDVTGLARLFGDERALMEQIVRDFANRHLTVRVAVADTLGAAWALAHYEGRGARGGGRVLGFRVQGSGVGVQDTIASHVAIDGASSSICNLQSSICNLQSPLLADVPSAAKRLTAGPSTLDPRPSPLDSRLSSLDSRLSTLDSRPSPLTPRSSPLAALPIEALRLPAEVVGLLHQLGIGRIEQLEALPREELSSRFGPQLLQRMDQANGRLDEPIVPCPPQPQWRAEWSLEYPTTRRETIEAVLEHLLVRVAAMLVHAGRGAMRVDCRLDCGAEGPVRVSVGLFAPTAAVEHLWQLVRLQLERLRLVAPVVAVCVEAAATAPLESRQQQLFSDGTACHDSRALAALVDRLSSRLGRRAVLRVRLLSDAQPELAWQYDPLLDGSRRRSRRQKTPGELPPRPLRVVPRPLKLDAMSIASEGPPLQFHLYGRCHQIAHTWGPERIETGWWRGRAVGRDYYGVETSSGHRFWLFRRLRDEQWFLHGMWE